MGSEKPWRWAVGSAGGIMILTAAVHALGYGPVSAQLAASSIQPVWQGAVKGLWLVFSLHLLIVGGLFLVASIRRGSVSRTVLAIAGLIPAGDTVLLFMFVGVFIGTVMLAAAAVLLYAGVTPRSRVVENNGA